MPGRCFAWLAWPLVRTCCSAKVDAAHQHNHQGADHGHDQVCDPSGLLPWLQPATLPQQALPVLAGRQASRNTKPLAGRGHPAPSKHHPHLCARPVGGFIRCCGIRCPGCMLTDCCCFCKGCLCLCMVLPLPSRQNHVRSCSICRVLHCARCSCDPLLWKIAVSRSAGTKQQTGKGWTVKSNVAKFFGNGIFLACYSQSKYGTGTSARCKICLQNMSHAS